MRIHKELPEMIHDKSKDINFSGVVYVKDREQVLLKKAYGYADRAEKRLNTYNTRFGTASGSKLFTAVAVCQLVEKGQLEFDTPLADCLAIEFPYFDKDVTIHHLLTHTSGLPDYFDEEVMEDYEDLWTDVPVYKIETLKDFLPLFQKKPMNGGPGERFHYNNAAYILLGLIIEQQTGEAYTDYVQSEILSAAGCMTPGIFLSISSRSIQRSAISMTRKREHGGRMFIRFPNKAGQMAARFYQLRIWRSSGKLYSNMNC